MLMLQLGVVGHPIAHSRSPAMHNAALRALGLEGEYHAFDVAPAGLAAFIERAKKRGMRGLNITIPHKEAAVGLCEADELARKVGAVNTLIFEEGHVRGSNTDVYGFVKLLESVNADVHGRVIVLGAGGAARAVVTALGERSQLLVATRNGRSLDVGELIVPGIVWEHLPVALYETSLLVDCTPRGLDPTLPPLDLSPLPPSSAVLDLVVARETRLVRDAQARGLAAATGVEMLLHQGAKALELWSGREAPLEVMRAALVASL
jgi:shikimate dehydrogenase